MLRLRTLALTVFSFSIFGITALAQAPVSPPAPIPGITQTNLIPSVGPLIATQSSQPGYISSYDSRFATTELQQFNKFLLIENDPGGAYLDGNHYGGLRSRLMWAIRKGEPIGAAANNESIHTYARGRRILKRYLQYSKASNYATQAHHNTGMADVEAYYHLEGDIDAKNHIWVTAAMGTYDSLNYYKGQNANTDARTVTVALQGFMAAQRIGIPFSRPPFNGSIGFDSSVGSWKGAGQRQMGWLNTNWVQANGAIPSPAHAQHEAYLFNAWLSTELLNWFAYMDADPTAYALAKKIFDHLIDQYNTLYVPRGWLSMPYLDNSGSAAPDLASFYVYPALALWQTTGQQKYYDFAITHIKAANTAFITGIKQWNQVFSTRGHSAEAMLLGVRWSNGQPPVNDTVPPSAPTSFTVSG